MRDFSFFDQDYRLELTEAERQLVARPITPGDWGGYQTRADLLRHRCLDGSGGVTGTELEDVYRKAWAYGNGTYQRNYFRPVLRAAKRAGWRPPDGLIVEVRARRAEVMNRGHQARRG